MKSRDKSIKTVDKNRDCFICTFYLKSIYYLIYTSICGDYEWYDVKGICFGFVLCKTV